MQLLKETLAQSDTVIFVGSGVSRWSGLPSWWGLIEELAAYLEHAGIDPSLVRSEARNGDLLQAASYGFAKLTKAQIADFIRKAIRFGQSEPATIHRKIIELGPSCYITTNYDDLLEQALTKWKSDQSRKPVTNKNLLEQAEVLHAQARGFIFKPHGDAGDAESIVLTREQYRALLPEGQYSATLMTLKTLLVSRPVVFIGFGLRDPDFLYVRDLLANIYRGGVRDHFAIVPDPTEAQSDYWRQYYGVHLVGYETRRGPDGREDHSALIELLDKLCKRDGLAVSSTATAELSDPNTILALARYGARFSVDDTPSRTFSIRVGREIGRGAYAGSQFSRDPFNNLSADRFLLSGPPRAILKGAPGAGKTFAIKNAAKLLANELQEACIAGRLDGSTVVPLVLDLKLYRGDLFAELDAVFPSGLTLRSISSCLPVKVFLDAFNEMPREYLESGVLVEQAERLLADYSGIDFIIGSRSADGLEKLGMPIYELSQIPREEVENRLESMSINVPQSHRAEVVSILQRPFYFQLLKSSSVLIQAIAGPADLYTQYINQIQRDCSKRFGAAFDVVSIMKQQAYRALQEGAEAFPISALLGEIAKLCTYSDAIDAEAVINWLIGRQVLVPLVGSRGCFVHQSITEYLAAAELSSTRNHKSEKRGLRRFR